MWFIRSLIMELTEFAPYERKPLRLLKVGKERGLLRLLRGRGRICLVFMRSGGGATTEKKNF